jgi:LysM repeat protein
MTRETKIGLLVGLAFIIVIGILLSDQLMRSTEPPAAPLGSVADTLRKGTVTPASQQRPAPPVTSAADASPETMVPTRDEITRRPPPVTFVEIRPGDASHTAINNAGQPVVIGTNGGGTNYGPANNGGGGGARADLTRGAVTVNGGRGPSIADVAAAEGEVLIGPDGQPLRATAPRNDGGAIGGLATRVQAKWDGVPAAPANHANPAAAKQYTVQPGDTLSKIAQKTMGSAAKANCDAIVKANPSLAANPDKVIIGVTYNIPRAAGPAVSPTPTAVVNTTVPQPPAPAAARPPAPALRPAATESVYVVQPGDNLTRIAKEQMGDAGTVAAIKELNRDLIKDWNVLPVGTKLRMPGKSVASEQ